MVRGRGDVPSSRPTFPPPKDKDKDKDKDTADIEFPAHHVELIHHAQQWAAVADDVGRLPGLVTARSHCSCWADHRGPVAVRCSANRLSRTGRPPLPPASAAAAARRSPADPPPTLPRGPP